MAKAKLGNIYVRLVPTNDTVQGASDKKDTAYYSDPEGKIEVGRRPWYYSGHPTKKTKTVMLNCSQYAVNWI